MTHIPTTEKRPHPLTLHDHTRIDDYYWLRDDQRKDPVVLTHLKQENEHFKQVLSPTNERQAALYEEMISRLDPDASSVPYQRGGYWYYNRFEAGKEYPVHARRKASMEAAEELLLDTNQRAAGHAYYALGGLELSDDQRYMAIAEDTLSRRLHTLRILDLELGEFTADLISNAAASMSWSADGRYLFYLKKDPQTLLANRVMRHRIGTNSDRDELVYEETDNTFYSALERSRSTEFIFLQHHSTETSEVQLLAANDPLGSFRPLLPRRRGHKYDIDHANDYFYIRTNQDAIDFCVMTVSVEDATDVSKWRHIIPPRDNAMVDSIQAFDDWLLVAERKDGLRQIRVLAHDGSVDKYLPASETDYVMWPEFNASTHTSKIRYGYSSLVTPAQVLEIDLQNDSIAVLREEKIGGGYQRQHFRTERRWVTARDGARVPVSLVRHMDTPLDGNAPALICAYGAYGHSLDPVFRSSIISLLERGFIYLIAHVRGGDEMGKNWYYSGRKLNKYNTFNDFIDVTDYLQKEMLIDPDHCYAMGGSAGGLLMAAVINIAPQLYHGVIANVPFVDVVTTMLDESIPLTTGEFDEWGNPKIQKYYNYMLSYSPYDQVQAQPYPNLMVRTGLHDSQVQYWEPAKWVARIRELRTNNNVLLLYTDMDTGHGGASGRYQRYKEIACEYVFFICLAKQ